jgi:hypothetical protein
VVMPVINSTSLHTNELWGKKLQPRHITERLRIHKNWNPPWQLGGCWPYMEIWVRLGFYLCGALFIHKLKSVGFMGLPVGSHLGLAMVGGEHIFQARSINPYSNSRLCMILPHPLKPWMNGDSTQSSNIEH